MTPRKPLPRAALIAVGEAETAIEAAAQQLRDLLRRRPQDTEVAAALTHLARAQTRCGEALQTAKGGSMSEEPRKARQVPATGQIVHYVLPDGPNAGAHRPAIITEVWSGGYVNLQVFVDGTNDYRDYSGTVWATSIEYSEEAGLRTWHWPEFVPPV